MHVAHYGRPGLEENVTKSLMHLGLLKSINHLRMLGKPDVCFIWIPKTAGTSTARWLDIQLGMKKYLSPEFLRKAFPNVGPATFGHMSLLELMHQGLIREAYFRKCFKFAFVRNPFDRIASLYYYLRRVGVLGNGVDFKGFLRDVSKGIPPPGLYNSSGLSQCNPQVDWVCDKNDNIFVDYIGDMETYTNHLGVLAQKLNVPPMLYYDNVTKRDKMLDELYSDSECISLVRTIYRKDFDIFQYSDDPQVIFRKK